MECTTHIFPLFGRFEWVLGLFWPKKMAVFGPKLQFLKLDVRYLRHPFPAATVEFLAHTLCGCPSHP